ncbi:MAG: hypothetical protein AMJ90_02515 [candidate division Zixibacteria bacterium SM23_73_2]|nr:MAG: hypothetical protein AMJ90_02515 [candidate division Zixibacteria bacterium SM23_73_2]
MKIINLTDEYTKHILNNGDLTSYEKSYPALFKHYFKYAAKRNNFKKILNESEVKNKTSLILSRLPKIERKFKKSGFDISSLRLVLFVGQGTSNGHAFKDKREFVVWIPIETYPTTLQVDVFLTHEIIHALHYFRSPGFYFNSITEQRIVSRQLITEGVATYLTKKIMRMTQGEALWADYLPKVKIKSWLSECRKKEKELQKYILRSFFSSDPEISIYFAKNPENIYEFRAGYYIGLKLVYRMVKFHKLNPENLIEMPRKKFEKMILKELKSSV